ncbi:hypothetical protein SteCoe_6791 [Stentor coeruleus]|uniref:Uncharacterized protein n=1 Tax=Stentor coeruleus TaxID=5963 RepID=A0A1R2CP74_9CILI|nr:hypothetical protein SteCoe_6791 [Stentor coeruleus]
MSTLVFINPDIYSENLHLELILKQKSIEGQQFQVYFPNTISQSLKSALKSLDLSIFPHSDEALFSCKSSPSDSISSYPKHLEFINTKLSSYNFLVFFAEAEFLRYFSEEFLKITSRSGPYTIIAIYTSTDHGWDEDIITLNDIPIKNSKPLSLYTSVPKIYEDDKYAEFVIKKSVELNKSKIVDYETLKREFILCTRFISRSVNKVIKSNAQDIIGKTMETEEIIKNTLGKIAQKTCQMNDQVQEMNRVIIECIPQIKSKPLLPDLTLATNEILEFDPQSIILEESQSENRTFHVFKIQNTTEKPLNHLKLYIKEPRRCLENFKLGPKETREMLINHEYDQLEIHGKLTIQVISCSMPLSNSVTVGLLDLSLLRKESSLAVVLSNRFIKRAKCEMHVNMKKVKDFNIGHFDRNEIDIRDYAEVETIEVYWEKKLISNTLKLK